MSSLNGFRKLWVMTSRKLRSSQTLDEIRKDQSFLYPPPNGGWGWVVVLAACIHSLFVGGFHSAFGVYMVPLLQTFNSTSSKIAWIGSVSYAFIMIFGPVSGKLLVKLGAIKVQIIGAIIVMFGLVCSSYTHDLRILFLTQGIIVGVGSSLASTPGLIMVSLYFTTKRSFATGVVMAGGCAGTFIQNKLHQYLIEKIGWRASLRVYSGILSICIIAGFAYKPLQKHRAHPSVVEKFKTSPLRGFIVDLSLWKDRIFEVWVSALGLAKFGFYIPFVHMIKFAGDLGIPPNDASYIMVGIGVSSMISCLLFGKICDSEKIDRLYLNQASVLSVGVVYFMIPYCKNLPSLVAICSLLGFVDAGNYVLLPVLTFDLMGEEKMPVAWGFMMTVNAISCFGPPFAGAMYDIYGTYTIGFVVTGLGNIAAAGILAFIPWLKRASKQSKKNYLNASVCEITRTIVPWQSPSPSLGSLTSSYTKSMMSPEASTSQFSKRFSIKSLKSILKSEPTSARGSISDRGARGSISERGIPAAPRKTERVTSLPAEQTDIRAAEEGESTISVSAESELSLQKVGSETFLPKKEEGITFLHDYAGRASTTELRSREEITEEEFPQPPESIKQAEHLPPKKEVVFIDEYNEDDDEEDIESPTDLISETRRELEHPRVTFVDEIDDDKEEHTEEMTGLYESAKQTGKVYSLPHRKEDGVAFKDECDSDEDIFESATDLLPILQVLPKSDTPAHARHKEEMPSVPHRKEHGVAFLEDYDSEEDEHPESTSVLPSFKSEPSGYAKHTGQMPATSHRKEDEVIFIDEYDSEEDIFETAEDLMPRQGILKHDTPKYASHQERMPSVPHRKEDGVAYLEDISSDELEELETTAALRPAKDVGRSGDALIEDGASASVKRIECIPITKENAGKFAGAQDTKEQSEGE